MPTLDLGPYTLEFDTTDALAALNEVLQVVGMVTDDLQRLLGKFNELATAVEALRVISVTPAAFADDIPPDDCEFRYGYGPSSTWHG